MPSSEQALPGRSVAVPLENKHFVHGRPLKAPFTDDDSQLAIIVFGLGCFWGAERAFWKLPGVITTAVGYGAGFTENPHYDEVCSGQTGHNELVLVVYDPRQITLGDLLKTFFESHDPTQKMRQGNDVGTQYRSGVYFLKEHAREQYAEQLIESSFGQIATEIQVIEDFYYAEQYHQQYLAKNPDGYCGLGGTGVNCNLSKG
ncbi:UNVERIFIED_CONTAM: hypothetical protein GTU68_012799 [Idotea baltica]|nr:hypothetical protein [Idotea baltica]